MMMVLIHAEDRVDRLPVICGGSYLREGWHDDIVKE